MKAILLSVVLIGVFAGRAGAQDMQTAVTLAERIADAGSGANVTIGALPPGWTPPVPLPSLGTLLGSVSNPSSGLMTLYYQAADLHAVYDAYIAALGRDGFIAQDVSGPVRGFAPAATAGVPAQKRFCKGSYSVYVLAPRPGDLRVSIWPPQANMSQMCGSARPAIPQRVNPLPLFSAPAGAQFEPITNEFTGEMFSRVPEFAVSAATITGSASFKEAWDSITSQLVDAGWQVNAAATQSDTDSAVLTLGSGADAWRGALLMFPGIKPGTYVAYVGAAGGTLNPAQAAQAQEMHLAQVASPLQKSDEPKLVRLVQRLLSSYSLPQTLYIGRLPPRIDKSLPLPDTAPLGSVETQLPDDPMVANSSETLYYTLTRNELRAYYARLKARGWWTLTMPDGKGSGFYRPQEGGIADFCKTGSPSIMIQTRPDTNANDVDISLSKGCGAMQEEIAQVVGRVGPMPPIVPPPGVTMSPGQPGVPLGTSGAKFRGVTSLSQLLRAFSAQLAAAGWRAGAVSANAQLGSQTFTTSRGGRRWQAVLTLYGSAAEAHTYYGFIDLTNLP